MNLIMPGCHCWLCRLLRKARLASPPEHRAPTHTLTITVPLNCDPAFDYNPLEECIKAVMPITKLGVDGAICGDVILSIAEVVW